MLYYTTGHTKESADLISKELYKLSIGGEVDKDGVTQYLLPRFRHPEREEWALVVDENYKIQGTYDGFK